MSIRYDLTINWSSSPRLITVAAPSTEITMQDLLDTLRYMESLPEALDDDSIVDAAGKENLGGGVQVGLTVTLKNALLAFEARLGPTWTLCKVLGGNLTAVDENGDSLDSPLYPTDYVYAVLSNSSSATLMVSENIDLDTVKQAVDEAMFTKDIEPNLNFLQSQRLQVAAAAGKISGATDGEDDEYVTARNAVADSKDRIVALTDKFGNRKEVVVDLTD